MPAFLHPLQLNKQLRRLLGRQYSRRLVQNQHLRLAVQCFQNLNLLLLADRQIPDSGCRVHLQVVFFTNRPGVLNGLFHIDQHTILSGFPAQDNVFRHRQTGNKHKVLMHHADAHVNGADRIGNLYRLSVQQNLALFMPLYTEKHLHQRTLSRAVLAHERMDLTLTDCQIHIFIGNKSVGVHLGDPTHFQNIILRHWSFSLFSGVASSPVPPDCLFY